MNNNEINSGVKSEVNSEINSEIYSEIKPGSAVNYTEPDTGDIAGGNSNNSTSINSNNINSNGAFTYNNSNGYYQAPYNNQSPFAGQTYYYNVPVREEPELLKKFKNNFFFFLIATIVYAAFYTFCLYKNPNGITAPFYTISALVYFYVCIRRLEVKVTKDIVFYGLAIVLLGINLFITNDDVIVVFDHIGIWLVLGAGLLHLFYDDIKWGFGKYVGSLICTFFYSIGNGFLSFEDAGYFFKNREKGKDDKKIKAALYVIIGVVLAIPLITVVTLLLSSADKFFGDFVEKVFEDYLYELFRFDNIGAVFMFLAIFVLSYGVIRSLCNKSVTEEVGENKKINAIAAITVNFMVGFVYLIFSGFQIFYLFLGKMTLPEDYNFAEYAREGFFQLVVVCIINMIIVLVSLYLFDNTLVLKISLIIISACTYIMIASSTMRMIMYVQAYQLSYTRVFVFFALSIIFMVMNGISIYIFKNSFPLFRYSMIVTAVLYMVFAYSNPSAFIARNNLSERFCVNEAGERDYRKIDFNYINYHLGSDAASEVMKAYERENNELFEAGIYEYFMQSDEEDSFRTFNISRWNALRLAEKVKK